MKPQKEVMSKETVFVCFSYTGVYKAISHKTTIEMYECGYEGQLAYCEDAEMYLSDTYPAAEIPPVEFS